MAGHDEYGKRVMHKSVGPAFTDWGASVQIDYGAGGPARIDGTIAHSIAVEIESRVSKQVRGAVLDLICHPYPKKLLVLLPVHMSNPAVAAEQCRLILARFVEPADFQVVLLRGYGGVDALADDVPLVRKAVAELGGAVLANLRLETDTPECPPLGRTLPHRRDPS